MIIYNKLIRDRISEIIEVSGKKCEVRRLNDDEYLEKLNEKLMEELKEYYESGSIEELADLVEVVHAIVEVKESSVEELERVRLEKLNNVSKQSLHLKMFVIIISMFTNYPCIKRAYIDVIYTNLCMLPVFKNG